MIALRNLPLLLLLITVLSGCSSHIFRPDNGRWIITPTELGYDYVNQFVVAQDGALLNVWLVSANHQPTRGAVLYFHGNARNISQHLPQILWLVDAGYEVVMADYRGFGASEGTLSLAKTATDMQRIMHWFIGVYRDDNTWLLGQSLGAALSAHVAGKDEQLRHAFNGVILDSGFASFQAIGQDVLDKAWFTWLFQVPLSWLMPRGYDADTQIGKLAPTPLLLLHSERDYVVPYDHAGVLYRKAGEPKTLITYQERHIRGFANPVVRQQVLAFLRSSAVQYD